MKEAMDVCSNVPGGTIPFRGRGAPWCATPNHTPARTAVPAEGVGIAGRRRRRHVTRIVTSTESDLDAKRSHGIAPPGFRLPDPTRVGAVRLQIADLDRSVDYYRDVIGLRVLERTADSATLGVRDTRVPLVRLLAKPGTRPVPRGGRYGLYHFAILLPDRAALGRFATHLSEASVRVGMADHLVSESFYLTDPDGLGIEVYADRSPDTWRHHGSELVMATDPLNVEAVMASGAGRDWDGVPPGTTLGHMHLHVGDLAAARAFYHEALGFDVTVWSYSGALFLAAGSYHHHLGTNIWSPGPGPTDDQARLLEWELLVPAVDDVAAVARSLRAAGYETEDGAGGLIARDPWGTRLHIRAEAASTAPQSQRTPGG